MGVIRTEYRQEIESYWVSFPDEVSLNALEVWGSEFTQELQTRTGSVGLLLDTNTHDFDSVDCLKWLKKFFTEEQAVINSIGRVAFVQPVQYRVPEVISDSEAYFSTVQAAYDWLSIN